MSDLKTDCRECGTHWSDVDILADGRCATCLHAEIERLSAVVDAACEHVRRWNEPEQPGLYDSFLALCQSVQAYDEAAKAGGE